MFCKKCGNKLDSHNKFCSNCGEPVVNEAEEAAVIIPEPPKDLVWNVEGYPTDKKEKKVEEVIFDWKADNQGEAFAVDDFYVDDRQNISAQRLLDKEVEKINSNTQAREEAILKAQAFSGKQTDFSNPVADEPKEAVKSEDLEETEKPEELEEAKRPEKLVEPEESVETEELKNFHLDPDELDSKEVDAPEAEEETVIPVPSNNVEHLNSANKTELKYDDIFVEEEQEEEKPKGSILGKLILVIVILLLLVEAAYLGLNYFIPENPTVKMMNEKVTQAVQTVESWFEPTEPVKAPEKTEPANNSNIEDQVKVASVKEEPVNPYPDNVNIKEITLNPDLKYIQGKNYGNVDINQSLPVTENTDTVVKTVVAYDSKWIDYVNNGDKGILSLIAPGSPAEKNTLSFTKVGMIKETFKSLQIGEVRKGVKGYYVWVKEEIQIEENAINTAKIYNWIYQVAPVENAMKIVDYFSYK